jgi:lipopolysaccharide transport system ATP-binding protein
VIRSSDVINICNAVNSDSGFEFQSKRQRETLLVKIGDIRLYPDKYYISLWVGEITGVETCDFVENCLSFEIRDGGRYTTRSLPRSSGLFFLTPDWTQVEYEE